MAGFREYARAAAGERWSAMDEPARRAATRAAKVAALDRQMGGVAEPETYPQWLRAQPVAVQDRILGARRAAAFRAGTLPVTRFTDHGPALTLEQLGQQTLEAWPRAVPEPAHRKEK